MISLLIKATQTLTSYQFSTQNTHCYSILRDAFRFFFFVVFWNQSSNDVLETPNATNLSKSSFASANFFSLIYKSALLSR